LRKRRRVWYISPEGFRELRHTCLLSRQRAADYLGVSVRTIRHWDAGRNRVPWSVVRLLRLVRAGELGGFDDAWEGWTINRLGLFSPDGRHYVERDMRQMWLTLTQASLFRESYDLATFRGVGRSPADTLQPGAGEAVSSVVSVKAVQIGAAVPMTALVDPPAFESVPAEPDAGTAEGAAGRRNRAQSIPLVDWRTSGRRDESLQFPVKVVASTGDEFSSGRTLPHDGILLSDCHIKPLKPRIPAQCSGPAAPRACACVSGPSSNTGLASDPGSGR
jgi:DNA-binding XRE family transcriptional regulator